MGKLSKNGKMNDAFTRVDEIVDRAITLKDLDHAISGIVQLEELKKVVGWSKAYLFYRIREEWHKFNINDNFQDTLVARTGHHPNTIRNYVRCWTAMLEAPEDVAEVMLARNIGDSVPIGNAVAQGYEIEDTDWTQITALSSASDINDYVRDEIKEAEPRKSKEPKPFVDRDGSIILIEDGEWLHLGFYNRNSDHPTIIKWINRMIERNALGVQ